MRFASVAEIKNGLSKSLARAKKKNETIVVTHHGKPYALMQPLQEGKLEELEWKGLARKKLAGKPGKAKRMPSTTIYKRGEPVVVNVPFTSRSGSRRRPALC